MDAFKKILKYFIPIFLELLLINLLTTIDTLMLSKYNELCVNAVGTANSALSLLTILILISSNGVAIVVGQYLGANKKEEARKVLSQGVMFNLILGISLFLFFFFGSELLLKLLNTSSTFYDYAKTYIKIYSIALPFQAITQVIGANMRAYGKPSYMMIVSLVSNVLNAVLNYLFIFTFNMGITGAAIATVIALVFKTICGIIINQLTIRAEIIPKKVDWNILGSVCKIGAPSALENTLYTVSQFILVAALNLLTDPEITARVYINMVLSYVMMFGNGLAQANNILVANYVGRHDYNKAKRQTLYVCGMGLLIEAIVLTIVILISRPLFSLFTDNPEVVNIVCKVIPIIYLIELGRCVNLIVIGAQKASGDVVVPVIAGITVMFTASSGGAWLFTQGFHMGVLGILLAAGLDESIRGVIALIRWFSNGWMNKSLIKD